MNTYVVMAVAILTFLSALTKGWGVVWSLPLACVGLPIILYVQHKARRALRQKPNPLLHTLSYGQPVILLLATTCVVGFGDTSSVLAFGVLIVDSGSALARISQDTSVALAILFLTTSVATLYFSIKSKP